MAYLKSAWVQPSRTKPSGIEVAIQGAGRRKDPTGVNRAKRFLLEYFPLFYGIDEPTPDLLAKILRRVDPFEARAAASQLLFYGQADGIRQFASYRPWDVLYPQERSATVVFYQTPEHYDGSPTPIPLGTGARIVR